ncbi:MAG: diaminopimelate decarboxylase [Candidatus Omnitrophica bacterium]|nr:diaminopimelate decarboxylase [Candidatus Omnitrophota bacterium]
MHYFTYKNKKLYCEDVSVEQIAQAVGTPFYCYSYRTLTEHFIKLKRAFASIKPLICFSMKSNSNQAVLHSLIKKGAGLDIVSGGELFRGMKAGCNPRKIVYAGVGKTEKELADAIKRGVLLFNVESIQELETISRISRRYNITTQVSLRVNPDVKADTHEYITTAKAENKFGINIPIVEKICLKASSFSHVAIVGLHIHIGSQIVTAAPFIQAIKKVLAFMDTMKKQGIYFTYLNIGGGLGIVYKNETPQTAEEFAKRVIPMVRGRGYRIILEPGRFIAGNSGIFVTKVTYVKRGTKKDFLIVDGGMNDLIRPSLYNAYHEIYPVVQNKNRARSVFDVVGPICESGDFLAKERELPQFNAGELMALLGAGAYGFTMSSNYNSRPRVAEVLVKGKKFAVVRKRETYTDLVKGETIPSFVK